MTGSLRRIGLHRRAWTFQRLAFGRHPVGFDPATARDAQHGRPAADRERRRAAVVQIVRRHRQLVERAARDARSVGRFVERGVDLRANLGIFGARQQPCEIRHARAIGHVDQRPQARIAELFVADAIACRDSRTSASWPICSSSPPSAPSSGAVIRVTCPLLPERSVPIASAFASIAGEAGIAWHRLRRPGRSCPQATCEAHPPRPCHVGRKLSETSPFSLRDRRRRRNSTCAVPATSITSSRSVS